MTLIDAIFGSKNESDLKKLLPVLNKVNAKEIWALSLKAEDFPAQTEAFKKRLAAGETLDELLPEAFALVREAGRRTLGERLYDVQLLGGISLHQGRIMEMKTGEGKTISCTPAAYLNSLTGLGVHVITVNDYLAERDAQWMKPIYDYLGVSVGWIISSQEPESRLPHYRADITYGTNNEFGFDYLRDNMRYNLSEKLQQHHHYCIIDEIDSILVDEARTPLIISGSAEEDTKKYGEANRVVPFLQECEKDPATGEYWTNGVDQEYPVDKPGDYKLDEKGKRILFTNSGLNKIEAQLHKQKSMEGSIFDGENIEWMHLANQAMRATKLFHLDTEYVVKEGQVQIVDEFTGRVLHGRRYSDGLHQAIEAKEGIKVAQRNRTLATITFQNFFRMYDKLSGMTGTAETESKEFGKIYSLDVVVVPSNRPVQREDQDDLIFLNEKDKFEAICDEIVEVHKKGQPVLVGTVSIEKSERLANSLTRRGVKHEVLNAKNHAREAVIIAEAGARGAVVIATNMAGRGTDIKLGGNLDYRARKRAGTDASPEDFRKALEAERVQWLKDQDEVRSLGGLYIIGTERHESRRIDNQLRGRSGRQGDPGKSCFFISLDDDLMRLFGGGASNLKGMLSRVGMQAGEALNHPLLNRAIARAQDKVEERNFEIRKHLLDFDDVLNEQRKFVYSQRDSIIMDANPIERILNTVREELEFTFEAYIKGRGDDKDLLAEGLENIKTSLYWVARQDFDFYAGLPATTLIDELLEEIRADQNHKKSLVGADYFNMIVRFEYLRFIDLRWQDHLENLDALREAVYLRSYAQKNPLLEYKLEGFQIFDEMLQEIRMTVTKRIISIKAEASQPVATPGFKVANTQHKQMEVFGGGGAAAPAPGGASPMASRSRGQQPGGEVLTVTRSMPKVGRNDPCPCGSGKKYKQCHGM